MYFKIYNTFVTHYIFRVILYFYRCICQYFLNLLLFRLGNESHKSRQVLKTKPAWCERFNIYLYEENNLEVSLWHKGKQKNFMGR